MIVGLPHHVRAFDVHDGRHLRNERLFAEVSPGVPDGIKVSLVRKSSPAASASL